MEPSGKLPSGMRELNRAGGSLRTLFLEHRSSQIPYVEKIGQGRQETSMAQQGPPGQTKVQEGEPETRILERV